MNDTSTMNTDLLFESGRMNRMAQVDEMLNNAEDIDSSDNKHTVNTNRLVKSIVIYLLIIMLKNSLTSLYFLFSYCDQI